MATTTTTSKQFTLNLSDFWRGLAIAIIAPVIAIVMTSVNAGSLVFNWKVIFAAALSGGLAYLSKNFFSPGKIVVNAPPETLEAVKNGEAEVTVKNK